MFGWIVEFRIGVFWKIKQLFHFFRPDRRLFW
ncbi:MAG: hypothetical protein MRERV_17c024 [Mycoplasmataceae bacterium RV_VA103A]|nr:MAG: hypothetical protein MRERV_17c024 [Mycoplasmataceae bacterium RV_VA103A]